jgi:RNA polymerase sigma factor (sigma-70 family)
VKGESSVELLAKVRAGDDEALERLLQYHVPRLRRWATGRLPAWARDRDDTDDLVQETVVRTLRKIEGFDPQHEGALQAYLRQALVNRVRDEVRRVGRHGVAAEIQDEHVDAAASPLEHAIGREALGRYEAALARLRPEEREVIIARVELGQSYQQIAAGHHKASADAARMAVTRALVRLAEEMDV